MKLSKYNIIIDNDGESVVYNTLNDKLMLCKPELLDLIKEHKSQIDRLEELHPSLYCYMQENHFIVFDDEDETQTLINQMLAEDTDDSYYAITINPTLNCNLSCWYCYEEHLAGSKMSVEVYQAVERLIERIATNGKTKSFHLGFFGGEPLLGFRNCVKPLIEYTHALCKQNDIELNLGFTTNAVLLTEEVVDFLSNTGLSTSLQIPFDGDRDTHNSIKKTHSGEGTYDITLSNLKYAVSKDLSVIVRCNYTNDSASSFGAVIEDMESVYKQHLSKINFSFHQIWQDEERHETEAIIREHENRIQSIGGTYYCTQVDKSRCYADKKHSFVVNYNGDIYQCTAREFIEENREGRLLNDGKVEYNERYQKRMDMRFSNPECLECYAFPICKVCTQKRLENDGDRCVCNGDGDPKADLVRSRILAIYKLKHPQAEVTV